MLRASTISPTPNNVDAAEVECFIDDQVHIENVGIVLSTEEFHQNDIASGGVDNCVGVVSLDYEGAPLHIHKQEEAHHLKEKIVHKALETELPAPTSGCQLLLDEFRNFRASLGEQNEKLKSMEEINVSLQGDLFFFEESTFGAAS